MNDARLHMNMVDDAVVGIEREQKRTGLTRAYRQELSWLAKEAEKAQKQAMAGFTKEWEEHVVSNHGHGSTDASRA